MSSSSLQRRLVVCVVLGTAVSSGCSGKQRAADAAAAKQVKVLVESVPSGAAVLEHGRQRLGKTPLTVTREPGQRLSIDVIKTGYKTARRQLLIESRAEHRLLVRLSPHTGTLVVKTGLVRGALVLINGTQRGRSPLRIELPLGRYQVEVRKKGLAPVKKTVELKKALATVTVEASVARPGGIAKPSGFLTVRADEPAVVTAGKALFGTTPIIKRAVPARLYHLEIETVAKPRLKREATVTVKVKRRAVLKIVFRRKR